MNLDPSWIEDVKARLPELPHAKRDRFIADYDLGCYDASVLVEDQAVADYFKRAVKAEG